MNRATIGMQTIYDEIFVLHFYTIVKILKHSGKIYELFDFIMTALFCIYLYKITLHLLYSYVMLNTSQRRSK